MKKNFIRYIAIDFTFVLLEVILWIFIWLITGITPFSWKFLGVLICVLGIVLINNFRARASEDRHRSR